MLVGRAILLEAPQSLLSASATGASNPPILIQEIGARVADDRVRGFFRTCLVKQSFLLRAWLEKVVPTMAPRTVLPLGRMITLGLKFRAAFSSSACCWTLCPTLRCLLHVCHNIAVAKPHGSPSRKFALKAIEWLPRDSLQKGCSCKSTCVSTHVTKKRKRAQASAKELSCVLFAPCFGRLS